MRVQDSRSAVVFADRSRSARTRPWLAALPVTVALGFALSVWGAGARPNVLLITLDTTRADHLGCYGYPRPTSPHLDQLCREAQVYTRAFATSSWTLPSHASLFTGKFSSSHGAINDPDGPLVLTDAIEGPAAWSGLAVRPLAEGETTLAEILRREGYRTGAVVAGPWMKRVFGLSQGFASYDEAEITSIEGRRAESVSRAAIGFLEKAEREDALPFFLFLNYYDAHSPYAPPRDFARRFVHALGGGMREDPDWRKVATYDAEIAYMDSEIGRLLARLRELGEYDQTLIIVTADHGELLGEHDQWGHGYHLYQEEIAIPFVVKWPAPSDEDRPRRIDVPVQLVDVLPMVLSRVGVAVTGGIQGTTPGKASHPIVAEVYPQRTERWVGDWRTSIRGHAKLLCNSLGNDALFDLDRDPGETTNRIESRPPGDEATCAGLLDYLGSLPRPAALAPTREVDAETRKALESLGYLGEQR